MERLTKRDNDGQAMMDCQKCEADWTGKHGKPMADCTALYCRNRLKDRLAAYEDRGCAPEEVLPKDKADEIALKLMRRRWTEVTAMRLIDADQAKLSLDWTLIGDAADAACRVIDNAPTVDAVVVTRCKDCKHSTLPSELTQRYGKPGTLTCHNRHSPCNRRNVGENDFCSYGDPKEGNHA